MRKLARIWLAAIALTTCTAPGCNPIQFEWQGPSDAFKGMDPNHDGKLTRAEWEQTCESSQPDQTFLYPGHSAYEFITSDCDGNGVYTWREYFRRRFRSMTCGGMRDDLGVTKFLRQPRPEVVLARQWPALRTAQMARQFETMLAGVAPGERVVRQYVWPRHHHELPLAEGRPIPVKVAATRVSRRDSMVRAAWTRRSGVNIWREARDYDVVEIELVNAGKEPIAVVMLQIRAATSLGVYETVHVKNVYIAPSGRENLQAWYPAAEQRMLHGSWVSMPFGATAADISVLGVRLAGPAM
jgi:hypothetical protein